MKKNRHFFSSQKSIYMKQKFCNLISLRNVGRVLLSSVLILIFLFTMCILGCGKKSGAWTSVHSLPKTIRKQTGTIKVSGAWVLYPIMARWADEFVKIFTNVRVTVLACGEDEAVADVLTGKVDIGMISREIKQEEIKQGGFYVPVVKDAVFPVINSANPVLAKGLAEKGIKKQTFTNIFINGKSLTWGEIAGVPLKDRVQAYTRSDSCGMAEIWAQYLGGKKQEDLKGVGVYGDLGVVEAVKKDPLGIGYNSLDYAFDAKTGLPVRGIQVISIDVNENGKVDPEEDIKTKANAIKAVLAGVYPSPPARDLYLMTKENFKGVVKYFVYFILMDGQKYVDEVGYIKLKDGAIKEALYKIGK